MEDAEDYPSPAYVPIYQQIANFRGSGGKDKDQDNRFHGGFAAGYIFDRDAEDIRKAWIPVKRGCEVAEGNAKETRVPNQESWVSAKTESSRTGSYRAPAQDEERRRVPSQTVRPANPGVAATATATPNPRPRPNPKPGNALPYTKTLPFGWKDPLSPTGTTDEITGPGSKGRDDARLPACRQYKCRCEKCVKLLYNFKRGNARDS